MIYGPLIALLLTLSPQATSFKISGTVVREDKQEPSSVTQANQVRISGPSTTIVPIKPDGSFEFPSVRPGTYRLEVGPTISMPAMTVVVTDKDVTDVRALIPVIVNLTGNVSVEGNGPRPRFQLAFTRTDTTGANPVNATGASSFTVRLAVGEYRLTATGLPAGYTLKVATIGRVDALNQPFKIESGSVASLSIVLGVSSPPPWVRVSGRVVSGNATTVSLTGTPLADALSVPVRDGQFEFPMVLPGSYTLRSVPAMAFAPAVPITVGTTDFKDVELSIPATKEITGKITVRGTAPAPRIVFSVGNGQAPINIVQGVVVNTTGGSVTVPANAAQDGSFKIALPEGERSISILPSSLPAGFSVSFFSYGSVDLLKNPLRVALNDTAVIAIALDATAVKPHSVSGKVTGLLRTQGVRVVLQGGNLGTGVESPIAADGSFGFTDILPGNYSARLSLSGHVVTASVSVGNSDVSNLTINYPRLFSIGGHILVEGDSANPPFIPAITLEARSATGAVVTSSPSSNTPSPFVLTVSDGEHKISVRNVPAGYTLKSMQYGNIDLQKSPLIVDGPITWEIIIRLVKSPR